MYSAAEINNNNQLKELLTGISQAHNRWVSLKFALFGHDYDIPPITRPDGVFTSHPPEKAEIFSYFFSSKQVVTGPFYLTLVFPHLK